MSLLVNLVLSLDRIPVFLVLEDLQVCLSRSLLQNLSSSAPSLHTLPNLLSKLSGFLSRPVSLLTWLKPLRGHGQQYRLLYCIEASPRRHPLSILLPLTILIQRLPFVSVRPSYGAPSHQGARRSALTIVTLAQEEEKSSVAHPRLPLVLVNRTYC